MSMTEWITLGIITYGCSLAMMGAHALCEALTSCWRSSRAMGGAHEL